MPASHSNGLTHTLKYIHPAELCRLGATLSLAHRRFLDPDHTLYGVLNGSSDARQEKLRSRRPFVPAARNLSNNLAELGIRASEWTNHKWNAKYSGNTSRLRVLSPGPVTGFWDERAPNSSAPLNKPQTTL